MLRHLSAIAGALLFAMATRGLDADAVGPSDGVSEGYDTLTLGGATITYLRKVSTTNFPA